MSDIPKPQDSSVGEKVCLCYKSHFSPSTCGCYCHDGTPDDCQLKPKDSEVWCEHQYKGDGMTPTWKFCPICGTPRPTPKTLAERLSQHLYRKHMWNGSLRVAESAVEFIKAQL